MQQRVGDLAKEVAPPRREPPQRSQPPRPEVTVQRKLDVGAAGDEYEREADQVARSVVTRIMRKVASPIGAAGGEIDRDTESKIRASSGRGQPLDAGVRGQMESAFGADFGAVRTHTGAQATELNNRISATAFTHGSDIYFRGGMPNLGSTSGKELLAHELTHTIQQSGGLASRRIRRVQRRVQRG